MAQDIACNAVTSGRSEQTGASQRGVAVPLVHGPRNRFERVGLYGCERQVRICPNMTTPAPVSEAARTGFMLADLPYPILLNLSNLSNQPKRIPLYNRVVSNLLNTSR